MVRNAAAALALSLALLAAPAAAAPHYAAEPTAAVAEARLALRDTLWNCGGSGCAGPRASASRPGIVCSVLAGEVGELRSFAVKGQPLGEAELRKCNARAKKLAPAVQSAASR